MKRLVISRGLEVIPHVLDGLRDVDAHGAGGNAFVARRAVHRFRGRRIPRAPDIDETQGAQRRRTDHLADAALDAISTHDISPDGIK